jgi:hypothetical protein
LAVSSPMPEDAPVTSATFFAVCIAMSPLIIVRSRPRV